MTTRTTTNPAAEADRLTALAEEAQRKAAEAQERAQEAARKAEAEHHAALTALRQRRLDEYDETALRAEEEAAAQRFRNAVTDGRPGIVEFVEWQEVVGRHYPLAAEARSIQATLDPDAPAIPTRGPAGEQYADAVQRVVDSLLANRTADFEHARQAEIDGAGR